MSSITVWFITGVSSGFGLDLALYALHAGHTVYGTVRNRERAADAVTKIETAGGKCVVLDVTVSESIPTVIQGVLEKEGKIDILVNNAGLAVMGALEDMK
jgi:NADP-dependent 3-hydroxy acid dehydrogenase YdfG